MKRITLTLTLVVALFSASFAQQNAELTETVAKFNKAQSFDDVKSVGNDFERVSLKDKQNWLAAYYTSLVNLIAAFSEKVPAQKDALLDKADTYLTQAATLQPNNDEVEILRANIANARISVDPKNRWEKYGEIFSNSMNAAKKINPNNPRLNLLAAQSIYYTPKEYGGGKDKALPLVKKSLTQFASFKPASPEYPTWGEPRAKELLAACEKK
ncbi:hypothetical protein GCM10028807_48410 [Spirosoma daeguense]